MDEAERLQQRIEYWQGTLPCPKPSLFKAVRKLTQPDLIAEHQQSQQNRHHPYNSHWAPHRGAPYGVRRGGHLRGGAGPYRHKTLVVNKPASTPEDDPSTANSTSTSRPAQYVSTSGRHKQLINSSIYDRITQQRTQDMEKTWEARRRDKAAREAARLQVYFANSQAHPDSQHHEIVINDTRFRAVQGGNKWINISHTPVDQIPRMLKIGGVTYHRSKHGNLYRAGIVKSAQCVDITGAITSGLLTNNRSTTKSSNLCKTFSTTGTLLFLRCPLGRSRLSQRATDPVLGSCPHGPNCHFTHDPDKVAICKDYLQHGKCPAGDYCDLSHTPSPHRSPVCSFFLRGKCTNEDCRYAHIRVNPGAPVCRGFATLGYCEKGADCLDRHVTECPDHANSGVCHNPKCRLPHVDRAGQLRKAAAPTSTGKTLSTSDDAAEDESSSEDQLEDVDSDEDILILGVDGAGHELTANNDFIGL